MWTLGCIKGTPLLDTHEFFATRIHSDDEPRLGPSDSYRPPYLIQIPGNFELLSPNDCTLLPPSWSTIILFLPHLHLLVGNTICFMVRSFSTTWNNIFVTRERILQSVRPSVGRWQDSMNSCIQTDPTSEYDQDAPEKVSAAKCIQIYKWIQEWRIKNSAWSQWCWRDIMNQQHPLIHPIIQTVVVMAAIIIASCGGSFLSPTLMAVFWRRERKKLRSKIFPT